MCSRFRRPQLTKDWEAILRDQLNAFLEASVEGPNAEIQVDLNFRLRLTRRPDAGHHTFIMAGHSDLNYGGWVIPELEKNLAVCIEEKTRKIAPYRTRYPEWWLVLVDFAMGGAREPVQVTHGWDKVIVVHPGNYAGAYEI